jgi:hypothetical protein
MEKGSRCAREKIWSIPTLKKHDQITRRIKRVLQKSLVDHAVAERKTWAKFGQERNNKPGPDRATTTVGEFVGLKISAGNKVWNKSFVYNVSDIADEFRSLKRRMSLSNPLSLR